ncbi:hypothetical protein R1sor_007542 [Riccia sorocarpa]|uniref:Uncharacterized protein n=1 Tax=Riccia sorocarpa TaxID=122646 RepID=A0ABD3HSX9_9MARC
MQASIQKNHRRNHWHAVVHFKMQSVAKGLRGFQKNVQLEHVKRSLEELSFESYQQRLKRKAVTGCKLLHQSKRLKSAKLEHATAQWRTAKLHEHFEKWYCKMAVRSRKRKQLLNSIKYCCRQLCLRGFQAWRAFRDLSKQKKHLEKNWLNRIRETLGGLRQSQVLRAWRALQKKIIIKRFNEARALQFYISFTAAAVVTALQMNMQKQQWKRSLLTKSRGFWKTKNLQRALLTWKKFLLLGQLGRIAGDQRRRRLLKLALLALALSKEQQKQVKYKEETSVEDSFEKQRNFTERETAQMSAEREVVRVTPISAPRPQPRRPAFLYENDNQTKDTKTGLKAGDHIVSSISPAKNPHFVAKEIEWMEQILLEYEDLKVQLLTLRAELALLLETRSPENREGSHPHPRDQKNLSQEQKTLLLQQEIHSLEAKKMVQMPLIQAVLSRVQDLRVNKAPIL